MVPMFVSTTLSEIAAYSARPYIKGGSGQYCMLKLKNKELNNTEKN